MPPRTLPLGIRTGFLGSGKTTLLARLLPMPEFANAVVIINEFGEISIDHLIVANPGESIVELRNGCLCCTVRGDLLMTLRQLHRQRVLGEIKPFDRVLLETSGLADPVPLVHTGQTHPPLRQGYRIAAVVTVVDVLEVEETVAAHHTAADQIAIADTRVLGRCDLVEPVAVTRVESWLKGLNAQAPLLRADRPDLAAQQLFPGSALDTATQQAARDRWLAHAEHESHAHVFCQHVIQHDGEISLAGLSVFLNRAVNTQREALLRIKGIAAVREKKGQSVIVHAVQSRFYPIEWLSESADKERACRPVFGERSFDVAGSKNDSAGFASKRMRAGLSRPGPADACAMARAARQRSGTARQTRAARSVPRPGNGASFRCRPIRGTQR